jgi:uncharacterized protein with von Willebrand factor type A (vWA) domain
MSDDKDLNGEADDDEEDLDLDALLEQMKSYIEGEHKNAVKTNRLDEMIFQDILEASPELKDMIARNHHKLETTQKLFEDLYNSFYKYDPQVHDEEEMQHGYRFNRNVVDSSMHSSRWEELRLKTMFNEFMSALAAREMTEKIVDELGDMEQINKDIKDQLQNQQDLQDAINKLDGFSTLTEAMKDADIFPDGSGRTVGNIRGTLTANAKNHLNRMQNQKQPNTNPGDLGRAISQAMKKADESTADFSDTLGGWGMDDASFQKMSFKDKLQLSKLINETPFLTKVAKLAGRMKRIAFQKRREKVKYARQEISGVTKGNDLSNMMPGEMVALTTPEMEPLFHMKYLAKDLNQYERSSKEKQGQGPIICCVDESGSMGSNEQLWSKAMALALANVAMKEKRNFVAISFSTSVNKWDIFHNDNKTSRMGFLKKFITSKLGGGTNFQTPLDYAYYEINNTKEMKKADIVFITDGQADVSDTFLTKFKKLQKEAKFQVQSILVGHGFKDKVGKLTLEKFSDTVHTIKDVAGDIRGNFKRSKDIFKNMA